mgnify:CR=1 FL=1
MQRRNFVKAVTLSVALAAPIVQTWLTTGLVPRFPTAILASRSSSSRPTRGLPTSTASAPTSTSATTTRRASAKPTRNTPCRSPS